MATFAIETIVYAIALNFTWNDAKRQDNLKKHGLDFADVSLVFACDTLTPPDTRFSYAKARSSTVTLSGVEMAVIVHTETKNAIHVKHPSGRAKISHWRRIEGLRPTPMNQDSSVEGRNGGKVAMKIGFFECLHDTQKELWRS